MGLSATGAWRMWPLSVIDKAYAQLGHFTSKRLGIKTSSR
jgi:hypothetical protein